MYSILIVEDNPNDAKLVSFYVEKMNCTYHLAENAYEAIEKLEKFHIDLILLDWMLPQVSGMDLLKTIKAHPRCSGTPVMIVSGKNEVKDVEKAIKSGASDYLIKPVDSAILEAKLQRFLKRKVEWLPVQVSAESHATGVASFSIRITSVSEVGIEIESEFPIENGALVELSLPLFTNIGIEKVLTKVFDKLKDGKKFRFKCSLLGLRESDLQKIRLEVRNLQKKEKKLSA